MRNIIRTEGETSNALQCEALPNKDRETAWICPYRETSLGKQHRVHSVALRVTVDIMPVEGRHILTNFIN